MAELEIRDIEKAFALSAAEAAAKGIELPDERDATAAHSWQDASTAGKAKKRAGKQNGRKKKRQGKKTSRDLEATAVSAEGATGAGRSQSLRGTRDESTCGSASALDEHAAAEVKDSEPGLEDLFWQEADEAYEDQWWQDQRTHERKHRKKKRTAASRQEAPETQEAPQTQVSPETPMTQGAREASITPLKQPAARAYDAVKKSLDMKQPDHGTDKQAQQKTATRHVLGDKALHEAVSEHDGWFAARSKVGWRFDRALKKSELEGTQFHKDVMKANKDGTLADFEETRWIKRK